MDPSAIGLAKMVEIWGPMAMGWVAWILTLLHLRTERVRYQELVVRILELSAKQTIAERVKDDESAFHEHLRAAITKVASGSRRPQGPARLDSDTASDA